MTSTAHLDAPAILTPANPQLYALLHAAAIAPIADTGWLRVTGEDRNRWLNGMVTNSIQSLKPGDGCYNFVLSAQGRIQGIANVFATTDALLLETSTASSLAAILDRFIIMDDVELTDISADATGISLTGPNALAILHQLGLAAGTPLSLQTTPWHEAPVTLIAAHSPLVPRFELWAAPTAIATLITALTEAGAATATPEAIEQLRILEATPRYATDIRDRELPQETAQTRALHFAKGCYLGQEIVERIRSRGNVHRTFHAFRLTGTLPPIGTALEAEGKAIGEITSVTAIPTTDGLTHQIALGYIRREALDRALPLTYPGGEAHPTTITKDQL